MQIVECCVSNTYIFSFLGVRLEFYVQFPSLLLSSDGSESLAQVAGEITILPLKFCIWFPCFNGLF